MVINLLVKTLNPKPSSPYEENPLRNNIKNRCCCRSPEKRDRDAETQRHRDRTIHWLVFFKMSARERKTTVSRGVKAASGERGSCSFWVFGCDGGEASWLAIPLQ